jgi:Divergent InlB B-repeat domain
MKAKQAITKTILLAIFLPLLAGQTGIATANQGLQGVTCSSESDCWAVGAWVNGSGKNQTLIDHWDGTSWSLVLSPNNGTSDNYFYRVTCASESDCWAVGSYRNIDNNDNQTLIEHWDGTSWSIVPSPNTSTVWNALAGVTCPSTSDCWAVGYNDSSDDHHYDTLIEHWDGTSWSIVPSPNNPSPPEQFNNGYGNYLLAVTCASASDCRAVGFYTNIDSNNNETLIEQWDGTSWSIVPSPNEGMRSDLQGVTCSSASDCWAVGEFAGSGVPQTLIEHWDGNSWTIIASPNTSPKQSGLQAVTCVSASECWAVGDGSNTNTLIEQWNGTSWSIVPSSIISTSDLQGVTCSSAANCWAVGERGSIPQTLIERWDGTSWSVVPSPNAVTVSTSSSPTNGGTTSGGGTYASGSSITVSATPNGGYVFTGWARGGSVVSTSASYTFTATSNTTLVAHFTQTYTISTSASPSAGGSTSGGGTYAKGTSVTVTATPNSGYTFTNWTQNGSIVSHSTSYTFTPKGNTTLVANFTTNPVTLSTSASPSNGGTTSGDGTYASGAGVTAKAIPTTGYTFTNWTENGSIVSHLASYTFKLNGNRTLVANFTTTPVTITTSSSPSTGGTTSGGGTYASAANVTVKATANRGHTFINWTQSGSVVSTSASYTFTATANAALTANFTP